MSSTVGFERVFALPELPPDSDGDIATDWLLNHEHKEPTQRVKAALKRVTEDGQMETLLQHYYAQIRREVVALDLSNISQLQKIRDYFLFPTQYLSLTDPEFLQLERTINSVIRTKIQTLSPLTQDEELFILSIGLDTSEVSRLDHQTTIINTVSSFAGVWNHTVLDSLDLSDDLCRTELFKLRSIEIFDIVVEYPATIPALQDLKRCMDPPNRSTLISSFTKACTDRLLHAGANTNDIILCYTSTIRAFLIIDPRGVLLDNASRPIRRYLREQEDTIPSIVNALLEKDPEDALSKLADELAIETEKTTNNLTLDWHPDPIDALPDFRKQDIIESLISIFDSREQFISELVESFAKKLLSLKDFDISDAMLKVRQLKPKFEENELNNLDVMIRDIADSEEIDAHVHNKNPVISKAISLVVLSYMYWPEIEESQFKLPDGIQAQIALYSAEFADVKKGRVIKCVNSGIVEVELEFKNATLLFDVSPDKASVVYAFGDKRSLTVDEVSRALDMDTEEAKQALLFWKKKGILDESGDEFTVIEDQVQPPQQVLSTPLIDLQSAAKIQPYWPLISEMLTNLGPMDPTKIQTFLKAVAPKRLAYSASREDLVAFLESAVQAGQLELSNGKFGLSK